jgi:transcriptional regulator with XRE-family HTH domain
MEKFGPYLKQLRRASGLTLKKVESAAGVSNAYLSQIERGLRKPPHPDILKRLAHVYEVPHTELLIAAGYLEDQADKGVTRIKIENAYKHVLSDPRFRHGTRLRGSTITLEAKRFIVEMYQKLTGQNLLEEG